jgi:Amt family ammonium transporter
VLAQKSLNGLADGALFGNPYQVVVQATAVLAAIVYSGVGTFVILKLIGLVLPLRATGGEETSGLDLTAHGEEAYMQIGATMSAVEPGPEARAPQTVLKPASI